MAVNRSTVLKFALEIERRRPEADESLEQFLMVSTSMVEQVDLLASHLDGTHSRVVMIGDDDHMSLLIALAFLCDVKVYDIDERVVNSINEFAAEHQLPVNAELYDVRDDFPHPSEFDFFYVNPPYSSRTRALGVKVWITRALEACVDRARGVIVIPKAGDLSWTRENVFEVQRFLIANGCVVTGVAEDKHAYADTNDVALMSTDYFVERVAPDQWAPVENIDQQTRIYR